MSYHPGEFSVSMNRVARLIRDASRKSILIAEALKGDHFVVVVSVLVVSRGHCHRNSSDVGFHRLCPGTAGDAFDSLHHVGHQAGGGLIGDAAVGPYAESLTVLDVQEFSIGTHDAQLVDPGITIGSPKVYISLVERVISWAVLTDPRLTVDIERRIGESLAFSLFINERFDRGQPESLGNG